MTKRILRRIRYRVVLYNKIGKKTKKSQPKIKTCLFRGKGLPKQIRLEPFTKKLELMAPNEKYLVNYYYMWILISINVSEFVSHFWV